MQHCSIKLQKAVKSNPKTASAAPHKGHCEKRCEIQGGSQEWL